MVKAFFDENSKKAEWKPLQQILRSLCPAPPPGASPRNGSLKLPPPDSIVGAKGSPQRLNRIPKTQSSSLSLAVPGLPERSINKAKAGTSKHLNRSLKKTMTVCLPRVTAAASTEQVSDEIGAEAYAKLLE